MTAQITAAKETIIVHDPMAFFFFSDSENPAEKDDPTFKLSKVHSASTVISNLSLISASIDSDLDTASRDDLRSIGGSSMRAKNSITARPVKSEAQPSSEYNSAKVGESQRQTQRALSKSQPFLANRNHSNTSNAYSSFNGHVRSAKLQPIASTAVDHSRNSSLPDPSDSDVDSYSDIVGQRSWKDSVNHQSVDLSVTSSRPNSRQAVSNGPSRTWASSSNLAGSVISFPVQPRRIIEDPARMTTKQSYDPAMNGTRQPISGYLPDGSDVNGDGLRRGSSLNENGPSRARPQRKTRSESQDPVLQNGPRSVAYGRSKSTSRQTENGSSDEEENGHVRERRWLMKSSTDLRVNHVITATDRTSNDVVNQPGRLRVSSVDSPARGDVLRTSSNRSIPLRNGEFKANHADQLAAEMQQGRRESQPGTRRQSLPKFRDDSQSSQDSTDYESRQTAAEWAAAALMNNHVTHVPEQPLASNGTSPQHVEMRDMGPDNRKLRREHLANLAHLQSSSC